MICSATTTSGNPSRLYCGGLRVQHPLLLRRALISSSRLPSPPRFKPEHTESSTSHAPAPVAGSVLHSFVDQRPWAAEVVQLHQELHDLVQQRLEPLQVQPTQFAPTTGVLQVPTFDGKSEFQITTHSGQAGCVSHKYTTFGLLSGPGLFLTKSGIHACMEQGTPFLDFELAGTEKSFLLAWTLAPRLSTLRHPWYTDKYYRSTPPGSANSGLVPFTELYSRMQALTRPAAEHPDHGSATPMFQHSISSSLWARLVAGHSVVFSFNALDPLALAAVKEHAVAAAGLWCALAATDWADFQSGKEVLKGDLLQECKELSRHMANSLDQDDGTATVSPMIGAENMDKLKTTVSGAAAWGRKPWWAD